MVQLSESTSDRFLGIVNLNTGIVTNVGSMGDAVASFTFTSDGTLYAVTGDGATDSEELYTVNVTDGSMSFVLALGNGADGEAIVFNPNDGLLYHGSQDTIETIDPVSLTITAVSSASDIAEITGMGYNSNDPNGGLFVIDRSEDLYTVSPLGVVTLILDDILGESGEFRGLTLAPPPAAIPSVSIYGLLLLVLGMLMMLSIGRKINHI